MNAITNLLAPIDGYKVYIGIALAIVVILAQHFAGISVPGVPDPGASWGQSIWELIMGAFARSAVAKISA